MAKKFCKFVLALLSCIFFLASCSTLSNNGSKKAGLLADFRLDGNLVDSSSYKHTGLMYGALACQNRFQKDNSAISLSGNSSYAVIKNVLTEKTETFSFSVWVNVTKFNDTNNQYAISSPVLSNWNEFKEGSQKGMLIRTYTNAEHLIHWGFLVCDGSQYYGIGYDELPIEKFAQKYGNQWIFLVATYQPGKDGMKMYCNGALVAQGEGPKFVISAKDEPLYLGRTEINQGYLNGKLDDLKIFDHPLDKNEINRLYLEGLN
jgi:hypothetical protein